MKHNYFVRGLARNVICAISFLLVIFILAPSYTSHAAHKHNFNKTETVNATCSSEGAVYLKCSCGQRGQRISVIPKKAHAYACTPRVKNATCTTAGYYTKVCVCGATQTTNYPAYGHDLVTTTTVYPTCSTTGKNVTKCSRGCSSPVYTSVIPATGKHTYNGSTRTVAATCYKEGAVYVKCSSCNKAETFAYSLPKTAHSYTTVASVGATCTAGGYVTKECTVCHDRETTNYPKLEHIWGSWNETKAATCEGTGNQRRYCQRSCSAYEDSLIPALGHNYGAEKTQKNGCHVEKYKECSVCEDIKTIKAYDEHTYVTKSEKEGCQLKKYKECSVCEDRKPIGVYEDHRLSGYIFDEISRPTGVDYTKVHVQQCADCLQFFYGNHDSTTVPMNGVSFHMHAQHCSICDATYDLKYCILGNADTHYYYVHIPNEINDDGTAYSAPKRYLVVTSTCLEPGCGQSDMVFFEYKGDKILQPQLGKSIVATIASHYVPVLKKLIIKGAEKGLQTTHLGDLLTALETGADIAKVYVDWKESSSEWQMLTQIGEGELIDIENISIYKDEEIGAAYGDLYNEFITEDLPAFLYQEFYNPQYSYVKCKATAF